MGLPVREALAVPVLRRTIEVLCIIRLTKEIPVAGVLPSGLGIVLLSAVSRTVFILMFSLCLQRKVSKREPITTSRASRLETANIQN